MTLKAVPGKGNTSPIQRDGKCVACLKNPAGPSRFCQQCIDSTVRFEVPNIAEFEGETHLVSPELGQIASQLISYHDELGHLINMAAKVDYLWKDKGGKKDGQSTLARIQQPKGELAFYSKQDYILWVAADHCYFYNRFQITAVLFHELLHTTYNEMEGRLEMRGHDFEGFRREVEVFGYWRRSIRDMAEAFETVRQPNLFKEAK